MRPKTGNELLADDSDRWIFGLIRETGNFRDDEAVCGFLSAKADAFDKPLRQLFRDEIERRDPRELRKHLQGFETRLFELWGDALDSFQIEYEFAGELARMCYTRVSTECANTPYRVRAIAGLQARGCRVAAEVLRLLSGGFAAGAFARWRTLHEIAVIAEFLTHHDEELSQRYIDHAHVEAYKAETEFQASCPLTGCDPINPDELAEDKKRIDELAKTYGNDFTKCDYGWAADELGAKRPTFSDIQKASQFTAYRADYKLSCRDIHGGSRAIFDDPGVLGTNQSLHLGPSNAGLSLAGCMAAQSLAQVTSAMIQLSPTLTNSAGLAVLAELARRTQENFVTADEELERREAAMRSQAEPDAQDS